MDKYIHNDNVAVFAECICAFIYVVHTGTKVKRNGTKLFYVQLVFCS